MGTKHSAVLSNGKGLKLEPNFFLKTDQQLYQGSEKVGRSSFLKAFDA
jgi:hypothetical protein